MNYEIIDAKLKINNVVRILIGRCSEKKIAHKKKKNCSDISMFFFFFF